MREMIPEPDEQQTGTLPVCAANSEPSAMSDKPRHVQMMERVEQAAKDLRDHPSTDTWEAWTAQVTPTEVLWLLKLVRLAQEGEQIAKHNEGVYRERYEWLSKELWPWREDGLADAGLPSPPNRSR